MNMNGPSNSTADMSNFMLMTPWLHFGTTDYLLFKAWHPSSNGAIAGACIGLFVFCVLERCLAAHRRSQEVQWRARSLPALRGSSGRSGGEDSKVEEGLRVNAVNERTYPRLIPPFTPSCDIPRGVIQAIQSTFSYTIMLAVMTFNAAYIISIILGLGAGEVLFGRIGRF